jgi:hypothetical protein
VVIVIPKPRSRVLLSTLLTKQIDVPVSEKGPINDIDSGFRG